jgi:RNA polymerase sigma-70 factor, ECF subfamily
MSEPDSKADLIRKLRNGDDEAFAALFSRHREQLRKMLQFRMDRRLQAREDPSDVLQEVYIDALKRIPHFIKKDELSFYVWLRQVAIQCLTDLHRRHFNAEKRDIRQEVSLNNRRNASNSTSMAIQLVAQMASPSQMMMEAELVSQIETALESMDELDREVLAVRHFEDLRNSEVAEVLGISEAAASNRYVRALSRLREVLQRAPGFFEQN